MAHNFKDFHYLRSRQLAPNREVPDITFIGQFPIFNFQIGDGTGIYGN